MPKTRSRFFPRERQIPPGVRAVEVREQVDDVQSVVIEIITDNAAVDQPKRP